MRNSNPILPILSLLLAAAGCTGTAGDGRRGASPNGANVPPGTAATSTGGGSSTIPGGPGSPGSGTGGAVGVGPTLPTAPSGAVFGPTLLRRLTNIEYRNTVQALLNAPALATEPLQPDSLTNGYDNVSVSLTVPPSLCAQYAELAAKQTLQAFNVPPCAAPSTETECASTFIASFGKRAFRRPLTPAEQKTYEGMYADQRTRADHAGGLRQIVQTMLQSPYLLYRFELGLASAGAQRTLTPYEVATELAYLFTASTPDDELLAAADNNALATPAQIEQAGRRLLALPAAKPALRRFVQGFEDTLGLDMLSKDPAVYPSYTPELRGALQAESARFIDAVLWEGDGTYASLLSAPFSFVNDTLAPLYGVAAPGLGETLVKTTLPPTERRGFLTQAAVLAAHSKPGESSPVKRGKFIRVGLLCQDLPSPPAMVPQIQPPAPNLTTRERFAAHSADPACSGCHTLIDPLGFGLENYDGIGQFRTTESGKPVDASGSITGTMDLDGSFTGALELASKLTASQEAKQCLTLKAYSWAFGRAALAPERAVVNKIAEPLGVTGLDIREALVAIARSDNFQFRSFR